MVASTFQTVQHPVWEVGRVYYRLKRAGKGPRIFQYGNTERVHGIKTCYHLNQIWKEVLLLEESYEYLDTSIGICDKPLNL